MTVGTQMQQLRETIDSYSSERTNNFLPFIHVHVIPLHMLSDTNVC